MTPAQSQQGRLAVPAAMPPVSLLSVLPGPVWGIDPSTRRIALAVLGPGVMRTRVLSLHQGGPHRGARLSRAREALVPWLVAGVAHGGEPAYVALEQPMQSKGVPVESLELQGMILAALWEAFGLRSVVSLVKPGVWKKAACGNGAIKPAGYAQWARDVCGWAGTLEDEAAALGVATWQAIKVVR